MSVIEICVLNVAFITVPKALIFKLDGLNVTSRHILSYSFQLIFNLSVLYLISITVVIKYILSMFDKNRFVCFHRYVNILTLGSHTEKQAQFNLIMYCFCATDKINKFELQSYKFTVLA